MLGVGSVLSGIGQVAGAVGSYFGQQQTNKVNQDIAKQNLAFQREYLDYQKQLQAQMFEREDTAVQRRKADLLAAGLSPVLAAGSGAAAGSVVPVQPLRNEYLQQQSPLSALAPSLSGFAQNYLNARKTGAEIPNINEATENIRWTTKQYKANIALMEVTGNKILFEIGKLASESTLLEQSIKYWSDLGIAPDADPKTKFAGFLVHVFRNAAGSSVGKFADWLSSMIPGIAGDAIKAVTNFVRDLDKEIFGSLPSKPKDYPFLTIDGLHDVFGSGSDNSDDSYFRKDYFIHRSSNNNPYFKFNWR